MKHHFLILLFFQLNIFLINGFSQIKVEDIKLDKTITNFKYATNLNGMLVYLPNGKQDLNSKQDLPSFAVRIEDEMNYEKAIGYINFMVDYDRRHGWVVKDIKTVDTLINNLKVFELTMNEKCTGKAGTHHCFYAFILHGNQAIIYLSGDREGDVYFDKLKKTFYSIHL